jgi:hypothetical protein
MTIETLCLRLQCLGWKKTVEGQQADTSWYVLAESCGHAILVLADSRQEAWRAVCLMALTVTRDGFPTCS